MKLGTTTFGFRYLILDPPRAPSLPSVVHRARSYGLAALRIRETAPLVDLDESHCQEVVQRTKSAGIEIQPGCKTTAPRVKIGRACFDKNRRLPSALPRTRSVCEEHCPTPKKAIWFGRGSVKYMRGETGVVKRPQVDPDPCIGRGIRENKCPVKDRVAVRVTSAGETRNPECHAPLPPYGALRRQV